MTSSRFTSWTFLVLFLLSFILVVHLFLDFLAPIVLATVIVSVFHPIYGKLLQKFGGRQFLAAGTATLLIFLGVLIPFAGFCVLLVQQGLMLYEASQRYESNADLTYWMSSLKDYLEIFNSYIGKLGFGISSKKVLQVASSMTTTIGTWFYDNFRSIAANIFSLSLNFLLMVALVYVFLVSGSATKHFFMELVPLPVEEKERIARRFRELAVAVFVGNGLISLIEGILGGLSCFIFGIPGAVLWGVVMVITAFLPIVGATIVIIPAGIYLFLIHHTWQAIVFLCFNAVQLAVLETYVKSRLIGTRSQMHGALVFMAVLAGIQIYGVLGLFYGPLLVTIFLTLAELYKDHYRDQMLKY